MKNANTKGMGSKASKSRARLLTSWAAVIALAASLLLTACPQKATNPDIFNTNGPNIICGYICGKENLPKVLVIPGKIYSKVITTIGGWAFKDCNGLTKVDFSLCKNLKYIDGSAFWGCTGLTELNLPESLIKIGDRAFGECKGLTGTIVFPKNLKTIESYKAFENCTKLEGADFSACTQFSSIGEATFKGCTNLKNLKLPASLTYMGKDSFSGCTGLTSVVFENKEGWAVYDYPYSTETPTPISPSDLADPSKAAKYLSETYSDKYWRRK